MFKMAPGSQPAASGGRGLKHPLSLTDFQYKLLRAFRVPLILPQPQIPFQENFEAMYPKTCRVEDTLRGLHGADYGG